MALNAGGLDLPIINVEALSSTNNEKRRKAVAELRNACEDKGFFYVSDHGVSPEIIENAMAASKAFFALDLETKMRVTKDNWICSRGYENLQGQTLEIGAPPDLKEGFYFGVDIPETDPRVKAGVFSLGPNQIPTEPVNFGTVMKVYHDAMRELCVTIMRGLALSLDLPEQHFDAFTAGPMAIVRLLHYPPQPAQPLPNEKGCGEHTDFGGITVLLQDDAGGLQVWNEGTKTWIDAPPIPGTFVVNLGDMMGCWTNDRYRSTLHRVINLSGRERYSIPYFLSGDPDMALECLPTCTDTTNPPRYAPSTVADHFKMKFQQSYGK
ncbi:MAG: 2-oxoglutarate and iron-dependent oxygenase domain-containing protein [Pseudomonadota bacterium]